MNGWTRPLLYFPPSLLNGLPLLPNDQILLASTPYTQGLPCSRCRTTKVGPNPALSLPSRSLLWVGSWVTVPTPQIQLPGFAGERKAENCTSPMPLRPP